MKKITNTIVYILISARTYIIAIGEHAFTSESIDLLINLKWNASKDLWFNGNLVNVSKLGSGFWCPVNQINDITIYHSVSLKQLPDILNRNNVYIHTKIGDWCPNSVLEAMSCGLPVICPSWGGTKELVGDAGAICQSKEWECDDALIDQMALDTIRIYKNLNEFSLKSRRRILDNFDLEKSLKEYTKILIFVLSTPLVNGSIGILAFL